MARGVSTALVVAHAPVPLRAFVLACLVASVSCSKLTASQELESEDSSRPASTRPFWLGEVADLPHLSHSFAPWNPVTWKNTVAICATMRYENATDVMEWLNYHRWIGVGHVYLTENSEDGFPAMHAALQPLIDDGFLTLRVDRQAKAQLDVYQRCIDKHRTDHNWMAFIDMDEYIVVREENTSLPELLDDYKYFAGLGAWWVMVGSSDQTQRPAAGGVLRTYTRCEDTARGTIKVIANMFYSGRVVGTPHNLMYQGMLPAVTEDMVTRGARYKGSCERQNGADMAALCKPQPEWGDGQEIASVERLALFHYVCKSAEDFAIKGVRGGGVRGDGKGFGYFEAWSRRANKTSELCSLPSTFADECCPEEEQADAQLRFESV